MKIATWNIAGGHTSSSLNQHDYAAENINYFQETLKELDLDIVCFQEGHLNADRSVIKEIAKETGYPNIVENWSSASHIDANYDIAIGLASKQEIIGGKCFWYPYPWWEMRLPNGNSARVFNKNLQVVEFADFVVINTQLHALGFLGFDYAEPPANALAKLIDELFLSVTEQYQDRPLIICGDFNISHPQSIFPKLFAKLSLKEALPDQTTRPNRDNAKLTPDHIFYSPQLQLQESEVVQTETDHYLCWAEFGL